MGTLQDAHVESVTHSEEARCDDMGCTSEGQWLLHMLYGGVYYAIRSLIILLRGPTQRYLC